MAEKWTYLSNHGHVLVCLALDADVRLRDVADRVGITERAVQQIVRDLEQAGHVRRSRVGRRNRYLVRRAGRFRHPLERQVRIGEFLDLVLSARGEGRSAASKQSLPRGEGRSAASQQSLPRDEGDLVVGGQRPVVRERDPATAVDDYFDQVVDEV